LKWNQMYFRCFFTADKVREWLFQETGRRMNCESWKAKSIWIKFHSQILNFSKKWFQAYQKTQLQISNSSAIRAQLIAIDPSIEVYCNRGTSGIDGSTSTAIGGCSQWKKTVFITGDIGFYTIAMHYGTITFQKF
jgi:2-succinyl-5-enolpyruvyl-6-hydroxy-3-cyclohexene-1-carboxylate synthase